MTARGLREIVAHSWRVRSLRPAMFALADACALGPAKAPWQRQAPWYVGRFVEWSGNLVRLDGCLLDASAPLFTTFQRGCFWLHRYEEPERIAVSRFLDPDLPVIELGASMGMLSCLINRRLRHRSAHVAVEANPALISTLRRNRELNGASFTIVNAAVAYDTGSKSFVPGGDHLEGRLTMDDASSAGVEVVTLGELLEQHRFREATLVCDIEGMEIDLWRHESEVIAERIAWLLIELHEPISGSEAVGELLHQLSEKGFTLVWERSWTRVFRNERLTS